jgi:hypothetical protein
MPPTQEPRRTPSAIDFLEPLVPLALPVPVPGATGFASAAPVRVMPKRVRSGVCHLSFVIPHGSPSDHQHANQAKGQRDD